MSRYQNPKDRFGRPLNPNDRDRFNRQPQGPINQPGRGPQPQQPGRDPQGPVNPPRDPNGGGGFNGGQDRNDRFGNGPRHPFNRFGRGNDRRNFRGRHGRHWRGGRGPQRPGRNEPPPIPKDQLTNDADAFWRAGRDLDLLTDTSQPTPGITLRRLGKSPFGEHAAAVELTLRRTWSAATTAAAALLRR